MALFLAAATAFAQPDDDIAAVLEEVIVTAQKREQNLQDVPVSVVALDGERIADAGLDTLEALQTYIPNFYVTDTLLGPMLQIRGIGSGVNQGFEQSVGLYVDGVYYGRAQQARMTLLDLERVEVLRGPQSTLFGHNSISGAVNFSTARPTAELEAGLDTWLASGADEQKLTGFVSGPLAENLLGRLAVLARDTDGYIDNLTLGQEEPDRRERIARGILDWLPTDTLGFTLKAELGDFRSIGEGFEVIYDQPALAGPFAGLTYAQILQLLGQDPSVANNYRDGKRSGNGDLLDNQTRDLVLTTEWNTPPGWLMTAITGWNGYELDEDCDCDQLGGNVFMAFFDEEHSQFSQELRLASATGSGFDWLVGAYYQDSDLDFSDRAAVDAGSILVPLAFQLAGPEYALALANTSAPRSLEQDTEVTSLFAQVDWTLSEHWRLQLGGRWLHETKHATRTFDFADYQGMPLPAAQYPYTATIYSVLFNMHAHALEGRRSTDDFLPSVKLQFDASENSMLYLSWAEGAKSGGYDARSNNPPSLGGSFEFDDEQAQSLEAGAKLTFLGGAANLNLAAYHTDYKDMQLSAFDGVLGFNVGNAARATAQGFELDSRWQATRDLLLSLSLALTDFEFDEFYGECWFGRPADAPDGINCDYRGLTNLYVADWNGVFSAQYSRPVGNGLMLGVVFDWLFSDDFLLSSNLDPLQRQDAYSKFNARLALGADSGRWSLALVGRNLGDEDIQTISGDVPLAGATFGSHNFSAFYEPPRTVALELSLRY